MITCETAAHRYRFFRYAQRAASKQSSKPHLRLSIGSDVALLGRSANHLWMRYAEIL